MNLYDTITQEELNRIIDLLLDNFHVEEALNMGDLSSSYCDLNLILNIPPIPDPLIIPSPNPPKNVQAGDEYIIKESFKIVFSNPKYLGIDYSLRFNYYDLSDGDLENLEDVELKTKEVVLSAGDNTISFTEPIVYLQSDITLIIKKVN